MTPLQVLLHGDGHIETKEIPAKAEMKPPSHNAHAGDVEMRGASHLLLLMLVSFQLQ